MTTNRDSYEIVRIIIKLAHSLGLKVVAEGTEQAEQIAELRRLGCEMAQGYFFSPPVDPEDAAKLLGGTTRIVPLNASRTGPVLCMPSRD
jgi:EAL domain-containing protein (putative c-di-GMP-specific phosphodiesterase class I)